MPILTRAIFHRALSPQGKLRPAQFRALGYDHIFRGWKKALIGSQFTQEQLDEFVRLRKTTKINKKPTKREKEREKLKRMKQSHKRAQEGKKRYNEELKDNRWIEKKNKILKRDGNKCIVCGGKKSDGIKLNVHHLLYDNDIEMWDVPDWYLVTLCETCHRLEHCKRLSPPRKHY